MQLQSIKTVHVRWPARPAVRLRRMIFFRNPADYPFASRQKVEQTIMKKKIELRNKDY